MFLPQFYLEIFWLESVPILTRHPINVGNQNRGFFSFLKKVISLKFCHLIVVELLLQLLPFCSWKNEPMNSFLIKIKNSSQQMAEQQTDKLRLGLDHGSGESVMVFFSEPRVYWSFALPFVVMNS